MRLFHYLFRNKFLFVSVEFSRVISKILKLHRTSNDVRIHLTRGIGLF